MSGGERAIQEVLSAEREWTAAHLRLDLAAIERLMADDYLQIDSRGRVVARVEALASCRSQTRAWESADSSEHVVRVFGDTALVAARWTARGENDGQRFDYSARFTSLYVRRRPLANRLRPVHAHCARPCRRYTTSSLKGVRPEAAQPSRPKKSSTRRLNSSGCSILGR